MIKYPEKRDFSPEVLNKEDQKYLSGHKNRAIRYYFYLLRGLDLVNSFRNLILGIAAVYIALKWDNLFLAVTMFIICSVILTIFGYFNVHKLSKMNDWLSMRFSTHYGIKAFNYQEEQTKLLKEIRDLLNK